MKVDDIAARFKYYTHLTDGELRLLLAELVGGGTTQFAVEKQGTRWALSHPVGANPKWAPYTPARA